MNLLCVCMCVDKRKGTMTRLADEKKIPKQNRHRHQGLGIMEERRKRIYTVTFTATKTVSAEKSSSSFDFEEAESSEDDEYEDLFEILQGVEVCELPGAVCIVPMRISCMCPLEALGTIGVVLWNLKGINSLIGAGWHDVGGGERWFGENNH